MFYLVFVLKHTQCIKLNLRKPVAFDRMMIQAKISHLNKIRTFCQKVLITRYGPLSLPQCLKICHCSSWKINLQMLKGGMLCEISS